MLAGVVLLLVYVGIAALHDPRGSLGTDTGGKLATVQAMQASHTLEPDVGYWAEAVDPTGALHPLYYTSRLDGHWVNVTTLPMIIAARPLAELGGLRAIMLLPMLGGVLCAYAGAALAGRLDRRARWPAFWILGLATPVVVYATDFWEHSLGLGLLLLACLACFDVSLRRAGLATAVVAGVCFGSAATMRTEALVYGAVAVLVMTATQRLQRRPWREVISAAFGLAGGVVIALAANQLLERAILSSSLRAARAVGTVSDAGSTVAVRAKEAAIATVGVNAFDLRRDLVLGMLIVLCVGFGAVAISRPRPSAHLLGFVALATAALLYLVRIEHGLGFVPGLLVASPFAVVGVVMDRRGTDRRFLLALACLPIPLVWASQYSGGALPQWGARYELLSGALLAVLGVVGLVQAAQRTALISVLVLALVVTAFGVSFSVDRSHDVADSMQVVAASGEPVISREQHLLREGGAFYTSDAHWLTAENRGELQRAVRILADAGASTFELLQFHGRQVPDDLDGFEPAGTQVVEFVPDVLVDVITYRHG